MIREAKIEDLKDIMIVIEDAKKQLRDRGSLQWNVSEYPCATDIINDIVVNKLFVYDSNGIKGCIAMCSEDALYEESLLWDNVPFVALHRMAVLQECLGQGIASKLLQHCISVCEVSSIRGDTHYTNDGMLAVFKKVGFTYKGVLNVNNDETFNTREIFEYIK